MIYELFVIVQSPVNPSTRCRRLVIADIISYNSIELIHPTPPSMIDIYPR